MVLFVMIYKRFIDLLNLGFFMANSYNFTRKIECIYKNIADNSLTKLTKLFIVKDKEEDESHLEHRKTHISRKWLKNKDVNFAPRTFKTEFKKYSFYNTVTVNFKPLFADATEFLETPLEEFCEKIYEYVNYTNTLQVGNSNYIFNYFYVHHMDYNNKDSNNIKEYRILYDEQLSSNSISVIIKSTTEDKNSIRYTGKVIYKNNKLILKLENSWNYVTAICSLEFVDNAPESLVGVVSGVSEFNKKIPLAKKIVLTKERVENYNDLYLIVNETEMIYAEENIYKYSLNNYDLSKNYFDKYANKLDKLDKFFTHSTENGYFPSTYYQLAFRELHSLNMLFKNVQKGSSYYVKNRYNILKALFKAQKSEKYTKIYMTFPIYSNYFLFNHFSPTIDGILKSMKQLNERDVEIEIIFIINSCSRKITPEFKAHLEVLSQIATIYFVQKEEIADKVSTIDFFFTENNNSDSDYIIYKPMHAYHQIFVFSKESYMIEQFKTSYKKIRNYAKLYKGPLNIRDYCKTYTNGMEKLLGDWYLYLYGSQQLWNLKLKIYSNNLIEIYYKEQLSDVGKIIHNRYQSIILAEDINSRITTTYMFDNSMQELNHAFLVKAIAKQYKSNRDMFTLGICSKEPIELQDIEYILGDGKEQTVFIDDLIKARLSNYIFKKHERL